MKWMVEGADSRTGKDIIITVDAPNRAQAEQLAGYNGVLVSTIKEQPATTTPAEDFAAYHLTPEEDAQPPQRPERKERAERPERAERYPTASEQRTSVPTMVPAYTEIINGAQWLNGLAVFAGAAGWVCLLAFMLLVGKALIRKEEGAVLLWIPSAAGGALFCLVAAAFLRTSAAIALAVRDIARNTFVNKKNDTN